MVNSLAPGRSECDSNNGNFNLVLLIGIFRSSHDNAFQWMPQGLTDKSTLVQVMAWCRQATSHYLRQCWLGPLSRYGVARPQWVNWIYIPKPILLEVYAIRVLLPKYQANTWYLLDKLFISSKLGIKIQTKPREPYLFFYLCIINIQKTIILLLFWLQQYKSDSTFEMICDRNVRELDEICWCSLRSCCPCPVSAPKSSVCWSCLPPVPNGSLPCAAVIITTSRQASKEEGMGTQKKRIWNPAHQMSPKPGCHGYLVRLGPSTPIVGWAHLWVWKQVGWEHSETWRLLYQQR